MKILQLNLNHCEAKHDLLKQTVRKLKLDLVLTAEPYRHLSTQPWESDSTTKNVIWSCGKFAFQDEVNNKEAGFIAAWVDGIRFYSCYTLSSFPVD